VYKKKTLRRMQPVTRRYARILNDLDGVLRRLRNLTEEVASLELDSRALHNRQKHEEALEHSTSLDNHMDKCRAEYLAEPDEEDANGAELERRIDAAEVFYDPALKEVDPEILPGRIHWEKAGEVHATLDPKTGECETTITIDEATRILFGKEEPDEQVH